MSTLIAPPQPDGFLLPTTAYLTFVTANQFDQVIHGQRVRVDRAKGVVTRLG